jgi:hypothetical protein
MARLTLLVTATLLVGLSPALAGAQTQQSTPPPAQEQTQPPPANPISSASIERIQGAVNKPARLVIDEGKLRIYVEIIAKWPTFAEMAKGYDLKNGPTPRGNPMTHAEFLSMVTPKEMYSSAGIRPTEVLQMSIVNWLGQAIIKRGLEAIRNAKDDREIAEIRARIDRELAALKGGR